MGWWTWQWWQWRRVTWIGDTTRFAIDPLTRSDWTSIGGTIKAERPQMRLRYAIVRSAR